MLTAFASAAACETGVLAEVIAISDVTSELEGKEARRVVVTQPAKSPRIPQQAKIDAIRLIVPEAVEGE